MRRLSTPGAGAVRVLGFCIDILGHTGADLQSKGLHFEAHVSSVFLVVEPSKIVFLIILKTIPQKEDRILVYIGYHSIPK